MVRRDFGLRKTLGVIDEGGLVLWRLDGFGMIDAAGLDGPSGYG